MKVKYITKRVLSETRIVLFSSTRSINLVMDLHELNIRFITLSHIENMNGYVPLTYLWCHANFLCAFCAKLIFM